MIKVEGTVDETTLGPEAVDSRLAAVESAADEVPGPVEVAHVVDFYHRYPGDVVTFYSRVIVHEPSADLTLRVALPEGLNLADYQAPPELAGLMPAIEVEGGTYYLAWTLAGELLPGARHEFKATAIIAPQHRDASFRSQAVVTTADYTVLAEETVTFTVWIKGKYLRYLPELYEQDNLMGRFLMLFESFWAPADMQIKSIHHYLDPRLTPVVFLPWLASWLDLELDERWSIKQQRQLIRWAIALHRSRGTKWGLQKYLEIYTGQKAYIIEHRAKNFRLGSTARLGPGIALGHNNQPHTFTVNLRLPALDHVQDEAERARQERLRRRTIESIIEMQKPAHTLYTLNLEILPVRELEAPAAEVEAPVEEAEIEGSELDAQASIWFQLDN